MRNKMLVNYFNWQKSALDIKKWKNIMHNLLYLLCNVDVYFVVEECDAHAVDSNTVAGNKKIFTLIIIPLCLLQP